MLLRSLGTVFRTPAFHGARRIRDMGGDFNTFLSAMAREAAAAGVSWSVLDGAFAGLMPDGAVPAFDRRQRGTFRKSFKEYAATRLIPAHASGSPWVGTTRMHPKGLLSTMPRRRQTKENERRPVRGIVREM